MVLYTTIIRDTLQEVVEEYNNTYNELTSGQFGFTPQGKAYCVVRRGPEIVEILGEVEVEFSPEDTEEAEKVLMA
jgi:hypothetical protein